MEGHNIETKKAEKRAQYEDKEDKHKIIIVINNSTCKKGGNIELKQRGITKNQ